MKQILATMLLATSMVSLSEVDAKVARPVEDTNREVGGAMFDDKGTPTLWGLKPEETP